ncbi:MAG: hypothetical protein ACE5GB_11325, partial [Acidimicrobiales bacterium]
IDRRFESIDRRFESIDRRFESIDRRFDEVDERWNGRFDEMIQRLNERYDLLSSSFHNEMVGLEGRLAMRFMETTRLIVFSALFMMVAVVGTIITVAGVN